jgi:prepilin-type N-terminal cleavage/methylation domain-containing protein
MKRPAFTLIELLVVIAIVGLLSAIATVSLQRAKDSSKTAKATADLRQLSTIIQTARDLTNSTLLVVDGSNCSYCYYCPSGDLRNIAESSSCAQNMLAQFNKIYTAAGMPARTTVLRDPWGSPYQIDENEGEGFITAPDMIWSVGPNGMQGDSDNISLEIPKFGT